MLNVDMNHPPPGNDIASAFDQAVQAASQGSKGNQILTEREQLKVEDLVLKRCWLARYWGLAAKLGVYPDIAHIKHPLWRDLAPLPNEIVLSAGLKAKSLATEQCPPINISNSKVKKDAFQDEIAGHALSTSCENFREEVEERMTPKGSQGSLRESDLRGEDSVNIDTQILVVKEGLRELADMKVEEAVLLKISQNQNTTLI